MRRTFGWVVIGLLLVAGLAGCSDGGDDDEEAQTTTSAAPEASDDESPESQDVDSYANETCTAFGEWAEALVEFQGAGAEVDAQLEATAPDLEATQETLDALAAASEQAAGATQDLVDDLESIDPPDIDQGEETHELLVTAFGELARFFEEVQPLAEVDVTEASQAELEQVKTELELFGAQLTSNEAFKALNDGPAELDAAFDSSEGCLEVQEAFAEAEAALEEPEQESVTGPDSEGTSTATTPAPIGGGQTGDPGGGGGAVEDFCNAVQDYVAAVQNDPNDPGLSAQAQELAEMASGLGTSGLTAADAERIAECSQQMADAFSG